MLFLLRSFEIIDKIFSYFLTKNKKAFTGYLIPKENDAWVANLTKDNNKLKIYLESKDNNICMEKKCVGLGIQIKQLKNKVIFDLVM